MKLAKIIKENISDLSNEEKSFITKSTIQEFEDQDAFVTKECAKDIKEGIDPELIQKAVLAAEEYIKHLSSGKSDFKEGYIETVKQMIRMLKAGRVDNDSMLHLISSTYNKDFYEH